MATASPTRPSRRLATRRKVVIDEDEASENENTVMSRGAQDDEEEFTPAPRNTRRSPQRRTISDADMSKSKTKNTASSRRSRLQETIQTSVEPSTIFDQPSESLAEEATSPTKRSPPKRRSIKDAHELRKSRTVRKSVAPNDSVTQTSLPTPEPSATPEARSRRGTPLADITESTINERSLQADAEPLTPADESVRDFKEIANVNMAHEDGDPMEGVEETAEVLRTPKPTPLKRVDSSVTKLAKPIDIVVKKRTLAMPLSDEPAVPKERMTITYLILTNFKSYAGEQRIGPFHASFSSVVGPNGSGKSNVIDSLLFVFGFRASKMRQGKISALIHNSARFPDLDYCEVEVQFQMVIDSPNGEATVVPDSQLIVSRRAFKNNSSKYYINGKNSDFTSVTTLLKGHGIDLDHKRFLILQGEVETIAQMKPKAANDNDDGLLEYLEDIIGTSKYKAPIEESAAETEALNEVCLEKSSRVQHVEKEKNGLEDKKRKALAFINDENELALKRSAYYQLGLAECNDNRRVTEEAIEKLELELKGELERHEGAENDIKALEAQHKAGTKEYQKMAKDTEEIRKRVDSLDKAKVKIEEKKKHLSNKSKKLEKTLESSKFGFHESQTLAKQATEDIARITGEIEELELEMQAEEKELGKIRESLKGKTQDLGDQIAAKQKQLEPWSAKISEKKSAIAVAQSELDILRERESAGATAVADVQTKIQDLEEQSESKVSSIQDCERRRKLAENEIQSAHRRLDDIFRQLPPIEAQLSSARQKANEARASLSASKNQGDVLAALTRLSESGRVEGFHGRLGNLGAIDAKYDVAISTACPALDNLVVDTVDCAQQCITYLRKNNLGRAVFITLDNLPQRNLSPIQTPENCPRLFDVVKSKHPRYLPAFYHALRDTLVASDSAQADRVAYGAKRWRVVSLEGKLVESSGVMSGGGSKVARGAMSSKVVADVTKDQVTKLESDRDSLERNYSELQRQQNEIETQIKELERQVPKMETEIQKLSLERDSIRRNILDAQNRIHELSADRQPTKSDKGKISALENKISIMANDVENLQTETDSIEAGIKELQDRIMEIGGIRLRTQRTKVDGLKEQIDSLNESLSAAEVSKTKSEKLQNKHSKAIEDASQEIDKIAGQKEELDVEAQSQHQDDSGLRRQAEEASQALEEMEEQLEGVKKQLDGLMAELNENRGTEVELRKRIEDNQKHLDSNQKRLDLHLEKLSKLTLHNFSEDGEEGDPEPVPELSRDEIEELDRDELKAAIVRLEDKTSHHVELSVLGEYRRRVNEYTSKLEDLNTALAARDTVKKRLKDLQSLRYDGFMEGFHIISLRLKEMYQLITRGGNAELELVDSLDPFAEGIWFSVMPPKKSWKNISNLSGGEKTLSSLALVFALHHYKPTPLYVMDEIDAALDFKNVSIVANYISERTKNAQFIVISLRNNMFEAARRLVGVYKVNHMTKSVTVENKDYIVPLPQQAQ